MTNLQEEYEIIYGGDTTKDSATDYYYYLAHASKQLSNPLKDLGNFSAIFWGVVRALQDEDIKPGSSILEVGSGLGYLTHALNKAGYTCEGLDYSQTAIDFAKKFFGGKHSQGTIDTFIPENGKKYDAIIATEVIEHVVSPTEFVSKCLALLKPGGKLILTTPIKDIHPEGTIWETEPAPVHLWWLTEKGIASVAHALGAKVSFVDFTDYTTHKVWHVHVGKAGVAPTSGPVMSNDRKCIHPPRIGYKQRLMKVLPAWMYVKLVCLYHDLRFLQKNKTPSRYMYGMCAVITKP
jgi:2-polyprenyl-3-methyl-5-hydroxy-6-metoxy-1,4-benzoquinol methylase